MKGVYQFAEIKSDLAWAAANGMHLIVMIEDRTFTLEEAGPLPGQVRAAHRAGGYCMERWQPAVVSALQHDDQGAWRQFDSNPNFEGVATQETSLGFHASAMKAAGYSPEKYRDSLITS